VNLSFLSFRSLLLLARAISLSLSLSRPTSDGIEAWSDENIGICGDSVGDDEDGNEKSSTVVQE
jgi:hypothetical protein